MNKEDLLDLAKRHDAFDVALGTAEVVRDIRCAEGNINCYATAGNGDGTELASLWRNECQLASYFRH